MERTVLYAVGLLSLLLIGGCQTNDGSAVEAPSQNVRTPTSETLTLSPDQLMALDWGGRDLGGPVILDRRAVDGAVEFDIRFPNGPGDSRTLDYTSSGSGGQGRLVGTCAEPYRAFALKFTLASVVGPTEPNGPYELIVGALIGPSGTGQLQTWEPLMLAAAPGRSSGVARTPMNTGLIRRIGFHVEMPSPDVWHTERTAVTLRVEPAPAADVLAQPAPPEEPSAAPSAPADRQERRSQPDYRPAFGPGSMRTW